MAYTIKREKAHLLRKKGISIGEVAKLLNLNKSTVSYWCRDIQLTKLQKRKLLEKQRKAGIKALLLNAERKRDSRILETQKLQLVGKNEVGKITKRDVFIAGLALYWGEGYKKSNNELGFVNTDPKMISFFIHWLKDVYKIEKKDLILRVSINISHKKREGEILKYWSSYLKIPIAQFSKSSFIKTKRKKEYPNKTQYVGTLRVKVRRATRLKRKIMGSIQSLGDFT